MHTWTVWYNSNSMSCNQFNMCSHLKIAFSAVYWYMCGICFSFSLPRTQFKASIWAISSQEKVVEEFHILILEIGTRSLWIRCNPLKTPKANRSDCRKCAKQINFFTAHSAQRTVHTHQCHKRNECKWCSCWINEW